MFHVEHSGRLLERGLAGKCLFFSSLGVGLRRGYLFDSTAVAVIFDGLSTVHFDDYLFDSKAEVVYLSESTILRCYFGSLSSAWFAEARYLGVGPRWAGCARILREMDAKKVVFLACHRVAA